MDDYLNLFNQHSDLILAAITAVLVVLTAIYVVLTGRMVREMRYAREAEAKPYLVATLVPRGAKIVFLRVHNAGRGPALNIEAVIHLDSTNATKPFTWRRAVLLSNEFQDFKFAGGGIFKLDELAAKYNKVILDLKWSNVFGHEEEERSEIDLKRQWESWSDGWALLGVGETPELLEKIGRELREIKDEIKAINRDRRMSELVSGYRSENRALSRLWNWLRNKM